MTCVVCNYLMPNSKYLTKTFLKLNVGLGFKDNFIICSSNYLKIYKVCCIDI